jgi:HSP20 family molecular chaperone IbpA
MKEKPLAMRIMLLQAVNVVSIHKIMLAEALKHISYKGLKYFMGLGRYMAKEIMKEIGNKSREFFEFISPPVDIVEDGNELLIVADLPGFEKKNITLKINDSMLSITATRDPVEHAGTSYWKQRPLKIEKKIHLPIKIKEGEEAVGKAKYANGVLEIRIPVAGGTTIAIT